MAMHNICTLVCPFCAASRFTANGRDRNGSSGSAEHGSGCKVYLLRYNIGA